MKNYKRIYLILIILFVTGCSSISPKYESLSNASTLKTNKSICSQLFTTEGSMWNELSDNNKDIQHLWQYLNKKSKNTAQRSLVVFIDGTNNDKKSNTNIWKLYTLAIQKACNGFDIVPYYREGVGVGFGNQILGSIAGFGVDNRIKNAYQFLVQTYQPGDKIYIFGFSRGAYIARSLNGLIEFAGLLKDEDSKELQSSKIDKLYEMYHQNNDGRPKFEKRHYEKIQNQIQQYGMYRCDEPIADQFPRFRCGDKVKVSAIGLFDTVPALGLSRDDYPDDHRTNLYADVGYQAMAIDEQRNDFRPLRFDDRIMSEQTLEELWFAGAHADVGGGYGDNTGLEWVTRKWMLERFEQYNLFSSDPTKAEPTNQAILEKGQLHDEFIASSGFFSVFGIHWRKPLKNDNLHCSVLKRWQVKQLPAPLKEEEVDGVYRPENLYQPIKESFKIVNDGVFKCL